MVILQPGTYCFNQFTCTPGCTVFFAGGLYNFVSGFSVNGIVNFAGLAATTIYSGSSVTFGTGTVNLAAPTSGNYAGVVFYNAGGYQGLTFNSTAAINLDGLVYVPGGNVMLDGTPVTAQNLVTNTITLNANSSLSLSGTAAGGLSQ
jgi:hypothetical protein